MQFVPLQTYELPTGTNVMTYGWGQSGEHSQGLPEDLQTANLTTLSQYRCFWLTGHRNGICALSWAQSVCQVSVCVCVCGREFLI